MKNLFVILLSVFIVSFSLPSYAQDAGVDASSSALSVEDKVKLKKQIAELTKLVGAEEVVKEQPKEKTAADVADRAIDLFGGMIGTLSENLKKIAPEVWRIMILQQYSKAVKDVIFHAILLITSVIILFYLKKNIKIKDYSTYSDDRTFVIIFTRIAPMISIIVFSICLAVSVSNSVAYLINPEYYAIKDMLELVNGK